MQKYEKTADVLILSMFFSAKNNSCAKHEKLICCTKNEDGKIIMNTQILIFRYIFPNFPPNGQLIVQTCF